MTDLCSPVTGPACISGGDDKQSVALSVVASCSIRTGKAATKVVGVKWFGDKYFFQTCVRRENESSDT